MKLTRRIVLILVVLSVAVLAFSAGKKAGKPAKKFPYLSNRLNETVTMTRAEMAARFCTYRPMERWSSMGWVATKIEASLDPNHIALTVQLVRVGKSKRINYRSRGILAGCIRGLRASWLKHVFGRWPGVTPGSYLFGAVPVTVKMYQGKKLIAKMGLPTRDPFGKRIPPKIVTIGDKRKR